MLVAMIDVDEKQAMVEENWKDEEDWPSLRHLEPAKQGSRQSTRCDVIEISTI